LSTSLDAINTNNNRVNAGTGALTCGNITCGNITCGNITSTGYVNMVRLLITTNLNTNGGGSVFKYAFTVGGVYKMIVTNSSPPSQPDGNIICTFDLTCGNNGNGATCVYNINNASGYFAFGVEIILDVYHFKVWSTNLPAAYNIFNVYYIKLF
jgi:hypothetical protein